MNQKKISYTFLFTLVGLFLFSVIGYYIYDPIQIFHKPYNRNITFSENMRVQAAGVINNYEFDSIIIGASTFTNSSADLATSLSKQKFVNLSVDGINFFERSYILNYLFNNVNVKSVIYSLDFNSYFFQQKSQSSYPISEFDFLYDNNIFNDYKVYADLKYLPCLLLFSENRKCIGEAKSLDMPAQWDSKYDNNARFGGFNIWLKHKSNLQVKGSLDQILEANEFKKIYNENIVKIKTEKAIKYINNYLLYIVRNNESTDFKIVDPAYSIIKYAIWAQSNPNEFLVYKNILLYLVDQAEKNKNLTIYSFSNEPFVSEIAYFKDVIHHNSYINDNILKSIFMNNNILTKNNVIKHLETLTNTSIEYDLSYLAKQIQKL